PQPPNQIAYGPTLFRNACEQLGFTPFPQPTANSPRMEAWRARDSGRGSLAQVNARTAGSLPSP
ncbi:MAG TPA: hypothetical protein VK898_16155, partial [Chloroflexota bacterium]|nr:hypothetical protein [Chloroflexota bacterium]